MKRKTTLMAVSVGTALLLTATGAAAQLYRCTDSDGRVVYSDRRCAPNEQRQVVKITDNSMDNSNLQSTVSIQSGGASSRGGGVAVIGNNSASGSSASSSSSSASSSTPSAPRPARRRCGR